MDLTINSSTGKTTVNACTTGSDPLSLNIGTRHYDDSAHKYSTSQSEGAEYNADGSSNLGEDNAAIIHSYCNTTLSTGTYDTPKTLDRFAFHGGEKHKMCIRDRRCTGGSCGWHRPQRPARQCRSRCRCGQWRCAPHCGCLLYTSRYGNVILADKELNIKAVIQKGTRIV